MTPLVTIHDPDASTLGAIVRTLAAEHGWDVLRFTATDDDVTVGWMKEGPPVAIPTMPTDFWTNPFWFANRQTEIKFPVAEPQTDPCLIDEQIIDYLTANGETWWRDVAHHINADYSTYIESRLQAMASEGTAVRRRVDSLTYYSLATPSTDEPHVVEPVVDDPAPGVAAGSGGEVAVTPTAISPQTDDELTAAMVRVLAASPYGLAPLSIWNLLTLGERETYGIGDVRAALLTLVALDRANCQNGRYEIVS